LANNQTIQRFRIIQGGRSGVCDNGLPAVLKKREPESEGPGALAETRKKNRLMLAKEYCDWHPIPLRRGWAPYPEAETNCRIESISQQHDELKIYLASKLDDNQIDLKYIASRLARALRNQPKEKERAKAAQKLAFLASDPKIYENGPSAAALSGLVKAASRGITEAKDALFSLGLDADNILRKAGALPFSVGETARRIIRIFSKRIDKALKKIENKTEIEL